MDKKKGNLYEVMGAIEKASRSGRFVRMVERWLNGDIASGKRMTDTCPFTVFHVSGYSALSFCPKCKALFPDITIYQTCPCSVYANKYVREVAKEVVKAWTGNMLKKIERAGREDEDGTTGKD